VCAQVAQDAGQVRDGRGDALADRNGRGGVVETERNGSQRGDWQYTRRFGKARNEHYGTLRHRIFLNDLQFSARRQDTKPSWQPVGVDGRLSGGCLATHRFRTVDAVDVLR
jgi:hypothetical protein